MMDSKMIQPDPRIVDAIASVAHAVNDSYRAATGEIPKGPWVTLSNQTKQGTLQGVVNHLMNPGGIDPRHSHELWLEGKLRQGWRYGETEDAEEKVHPCLLPYHSLPENQRVKDYLFGAVVAALGPLLIPKPSIGKSMRSPEEKTFVPGPLKGGLVQGMTKASGERQEVSDAHGSS